MAQAGPTRSSRRHRGDSGFLAFDEIALFSSALVAGPARAARPGGSTSESMSCAASSVERLRFLRLRTAWNRAVGLHLKSVSAPSLYRSSELIVEVRDAAWRRELERVAPEILSRLARLLPDLPVTRVRFRIGPAGRISRSAEWAETTPPAPLPETPPLELGPPVDEAAPHSLDRVRDGHLRERLREVMGRYLARSG